MTATAQAGVAESGVGASEKGLPRSSRAPLRSVGRVLEIAFYGAFHGTRFAGRWIGARLSGGDSARSLFGRFVTELCESLGATFVKAGQVLSSRPDLLSEEVAAPLQRLQDQVAPFDTRQIPSLIEDAFGRPIEEVFERFDLEPVSSASVAHVHRARLPGAARPGDSREVAVKIRRPGVVRQVEDDLRLMRLFAALVDKIPAMRVVPLAELVEEIALAVTQQLDFELEAENNRRFTENFAGVDTIKLPRLIHPLCCESVLTMEFFDGLIKVDAPGAVSEQHRETAAVSGLRALYKMIFVDGFVHADMHPGNIFLRRGGELILLDLGLVAELQGDDLDQFVDFFLGMVTDDGARCARVVCDTAIYFAPGFDRAAFDQDMIEMIGRHASLCAADFEVTRFAFELFDTQRRHGIRGATLFTMTILSLVVYEGIVKKLHPGLDFQKEARGYLIAAKYRRPRAS